eukprot:7254770-Ditylum_brightwellii.AAC.1
MTMLTRSNIIPNKKSTLVHRRESRRPLKKHHQNNDYISNEETNAINKFRSMSNSDNNSNDKDKPKGTEKCCD